MIKAPATAATAAKVEASETVILPLATGRLAVRFINASVSFSVIWLMALAAPVTSNPPVNNKRTDKKLKAILKRQQIADHT